jgi:Flp pilus assembly protein protease CpaA
MDFNYIPLLTAFFGSSLAAIFDLKTTEVPDEIPLSMILVAVTFYFFQSFFTQNFNLLLNSLMAGISLLAFGGIMYYFGQWGGADALILSAFGFLLPVIPKNFASTFFPFPLTYLINSFFVGAAYMLFYAFIFSIRNERIIKKFKQQLKASSRIMLSFTLIIFVIFSILTYFLKLYFPLSLKSLLFIPLLTAFLTLSIFIIFKFTKCVEDFGFKRKIPISELKVGDVLLEFKQFRGIKPNEIMKIRRSGKKYVWIKEGVRYAPVFPLTLILTLYLGDLIFWVNYFKFYLIFLVSLSHPYISTIHEVF